MSFNKGGIINYGKEGKIHKKFGLHFVDFVDISDPCKKGHVSATGMDPCEKCPVGHYQDQEKEVTCKICPVGRYQNTTGKFSKLFLPLVATSFYLCLLLPGCGSGLYLLP